MGDRAVLILRVAARKNKRKILKSDAVAKIWSNFKDKLSDVK